jgi:glycosyltransferase involved in cell wall biosynthesis
MNPRLAIVTPSYQQGRFLRETVASVLSQGVECAEYFVADGGSTDESVSVLESFGGAVRWVSQKDRGQAHAVNKAMAATSAPVIGWINSDDVYLPGAFEAVLTHFEAHPEDDVVYGEADHIDERGVRLGPYPVEDWNWERLIETCYLCQPAVFFRRRVVERFGALDERLQYCMDHEYWLRCGRAGARFARIPAKLALSRLYAQNKTLGSRVKVHAEQCEMFRRLLGEVPDLWLYHYAHAVAEARGVRREDILRFHWTIALETWKAALRWRGGVPLSIRKTTWEWVVTGVKKGLQVGGR